VKTKLKRLIRAVSYTINAIFFEWPRGIDFSMRDKYSSRDVSLNGYARTSKKALINLFRKIIGSGKGAVVFDAFCLGANLSHGIEFNEKLHNIAVSNFKRLNCSSICKSINVDARNFYNYKDYDVFFLFNPFNDEVYFNVMSRIKVQIFNDPKIRYIVAYGKSNNSAIMLIEKIKKIEQGICPFRNTEFSIYQIN
jgi:16S rRNA G966 N2-methylase RsmD